jgi:hypothetical protein
VAQIVVDIEPEIVERLELRAKRLGSTVQREASRLITERLEAEPGPSSTAAESTGEDAEVDPRFVRDHGFLLFAGNVAPDEIPDHRALQDERIDALVKGAGAGRV